MTPATSSSPAAETVADGIAPADRSVGRVPDVAATVTARRGFREMLPRRSGKLVTGLVLTLGIIAFAFIAPFFTQDPGNVDSAANLPPSLDHLLGTNNIGADLFAQLAAGRPAR
ncbi:hypothetical protein NKG05_08720 [Oerskovia sp. M15]